MGDSTLSISNMVGIAANGVLIFNGNSPRNTDYFYPKDWEGSSNTVIDTTLDACLGAITPIDGMYHYWFLPPCLYMSDMLETSKYCDNVTSCNADMATYALDVYTTYHSTSTLVGMSKDGHKIIGPYKEDGTIFNC